MAAQEADRSLHDALCVVRCLVHRRALIPGGAAPEVELSLQLGRWAKTLKVRMRMHASMHACGSAHACI